MKNILTNYKLHLVLRYLIGLVFVFSGIEKIISPEHFAVSIINYKMFPTEIVNIIAITLPWLELIVGILLIFGLYVRENALIVNAMLLLFTIMVLVALLRGLDIDCGCFGTLDHQKVGIQKITENLLLLISGIILMRYYSQKLYKIENLQ
ncbi:MAG: DoxX family membrane protein [Melioribacteraceae bacterium]|nr:DoxX family membrane protein [Melioribacteraceae bacterium]MCF8352874.1 DoxX family membrane protein [Melioribacteraceae bacterium]MCF8393809.1 DoxX family membrane protein [Melioribacteraceae bacterium]MCF8417391.1 DoxX family membrane protein [Melioribacteraceae bacterium]